MDPTSTVVDIYRLVTEDIGRKLLRESAGSESCCIVRIPQSLARINLKAYEPKILSIGPYHHGKEHLQMTQQHKRRFLKFFVAKMEEKGIDPQELVKAVSSLENIIRGSYSEDLGFDSEKLNAMDFAVDPSRSSPFGKPETFWEKHYGLEAKHLLDLIRKTFVPVTSQRSIKDHNYLTILCCSEGKHGETSSKSSDHEYLGFVLSAKKLHLRGIKFEARKNTDSILDIGYSNGVLHIPPVVMDDFTASVFLNCVAFEQLYADSSNHITSYVAFMACLINEESDAAFLSERRILENYFGTEDEVSRFYKSIGKDIALDLEKSYLAKVFEGVNKYTSKGFHVHCAEFVHTHFDSPWTFASSFAALLLLMFAALQVFFAAYSYFRPPKGK
ncbi:PREDICTED: UPF0481 protein At3g47200-like isoform X2 [Camelina sativa]|uniref:UPF0481 protein At3g47200-like isoform X2 n=1 Tax=Camelina sativa TaxID=90675 RepID=A0ABM0XZT0_CAMSA|nr:PREDICTED: UPF0481 protein At3g47200-like isoform X2 [Camelina sativa]